MKRAQDPPRPHESTPPSVPGGARRSRRWWAALAWVALGSLAWLAPRTTRADEIVHVVGKGNTLDGIARRYHTTVAAILAKNELKSAHDIRPGQELRIEVDPTRFTPRERADLERAKARAKKKAKPAASPAKADSQAVSRGKAAPTAPTTAGKAKASTTTDPYAKKPARAGHVKLVRGEESFQGQLVNAKGKVRSKAAAALNHLLRDYRKGDAVAIDERLLSLLANVSDHFGGETIVVVSGYRAKTPTQYTKNSRHNHGKAIDFRIVGVPIEVLRDYCETFSKVGVGYYPRSQFIHLDVRDVKVRWTDYSGPGEAPRYGRRPAVPAPKSASEDEREPDENESGKTPAANVK